MILRAPFYQGGTMNSISYEAFLANKDPKLLRALEPDASQLPPENIDPMNPYPAPHLGFFREEVMAGEEKREIYFFIPDTFEPCGDAVSIFLDDGEDPADFLSTSTWLDVAQEKGIALKVVGPGGKWDLTDGAKRELAFMKAWGYFEYLQQLFITNFCANYAIGFGRGADALLAMTAAMAPGRRAGVVAWGASDEGSELLLQLGDAPTKRPGVKKNQMPVPVWLLGKDAECEKKAAYFCGVGQCEEYVGQGDKGKVYRPKLNWSKGSINEQPVWQVISGRTKNMPGRDSRAFIDMALDFLTTVCSGAGSNHVDGILIPNVHWTALGAERVRKVIDGKMREWIVYIPEKLKNTGKKYPLLMSLHGYSGKGTDHLTGSELYKIADQRDVIVVCPSGFRAAETCFRISRRATQQQWNSHMEWKGGDTDDVSFLDQLMDDLLENYPIDPARCYLAGVSNGSMMVEKAMFMITERFAAYAASSGNMNDTHNPDENILPQDLTVMPHFRQGVRAAAWIIKGEFDFAQKGMDVTLEEGKSNYELLKRIAQENGMAFDKDYQSQNGVWENHTWLDGDRAPILRYTLGGGYPHGYPTELLWQIWDGFFAHFRREEDGTLTYLY